MQTFPKVGLDKFLVPEKLRRSPDRSPCALRWQSHEPTTVINNVTALAKTAKAYQVPTILTIINAKHGGESFEQQQCAHGGWTSTQSVTELTI